MRPPSGRAYGKVDGIPALVNDSLSMSGSDAAAAAAAAAASVAAGIFPEAAAAAAGEMKNGNCQPAVVPAAL